MNKCIAVINQKGGVGKTSTACNLAYHISLQYPVLLIDLDPSANASSAFMEFDFDHYYFTSKKLFLKKEIYDWSKNVIMPFKNEGVNLFLIPSTIELATIDRDLNRHPFKETRLAKSLHGLLTDYAIKTNLACNNLLESPYVILDCPPTLSDLTVNAIYAANFILTPICYDSYSLLGCSDLDQVIEEVKEGQFYKQKLLRNRRDETTTKINKYIDDQIADMEDLVLKTVIKKCADIPTATAARLPVKKYAPLSKAAIDYQNLTNEIYFELGYMLGEMPSEK